MAFIAVNYFHKKAIQMFVKVLSTCRSSRSQMLFKMSALKYITGKQLCWSLFLIKLQAQACNFIKKKLKRRCFLVKFAKHFFSQNTSGGSFRSHLVYNFSKLYFSVVLHFLMIFCTFQLILLNSVLFELSLYLLSQLGNCIV